MLSQAGESSWASLEESHKKGLRLGKAMVCIYLGNMGHSPCRSRKTMVMKHLLQSVGVLVFS